MIALRNNDPGAGSRGGPGIFFFLVACCLVYLA